MVNFGAGKMALPPSVAKRMLLLPLRLPGYLFASISQLGHAGYSLIAAIFASGSTTLYQQLHGDFTSRHGGVRYARAASIAALPRADRWPIGPVACRARTPHMSTRHIILIILG